MAFNDLDTPEMVSVFSPFVNDPKVKKDFLSIPELTGLHKQVVSAYEGVVSVRPAEAAADSELQAIMAQQKKVDFRHDRYTRFLVLALEAQRELALAEDPPNTERAEACDAASLAILPGGTGIINASYHAEAGSTERMQKHLDSAEGKKTAAVLKSVPVKGKETALDVVQSLIAVGAELGKLEAKKAARNAALASTPAAPQRVIQGARSKWISVASLIVQAVELSDAPESVKAAIVRPLLDAAERAGKRGARRGAAPKGEGEPSDAAPGEASDK